MLDRIPELPATFLPPEEYAPDATGRFANIEDFFWKLERRQTFQEEEDASYRAFMRGDWDEALRIEDESLGALRDRFKKARFEHRRIRVVELPVTPYLQWEMQALRVRFDAGERIGVLDVANKAIRDRERNRILPEVIIVGTEALYEVGYDQAGVHNGARRIFDQQVISACRAEMTVLWGKAEDFTTFFAREIAPLPPPPAQR